MGRNWVHAAVAAESRFLIDLRLGPRTLGTAAAMVAVVAARCLGTLPLLLVDGHPPYPAAILQVFGVAKRGRRPFDSAQGEGGRGRPKRDRLEPPPGLMVGVVNKMADKSGRVFRVRRHALFGRLGDVRRTLRELGLGTDVNASHVERFNGTCRAGASPGWPGGPATGRAAAAAARRCGRRCRGSGTCTTGAAHTGRSRPA